MITQSAVSRDLRKEEECLREAEDDLQQVTVARAKLAETEANKVAEEVLLEGILEGLKEATQGLRDNLEGAQAQLADAERATATIQVSYDIVLPMMWCVVWLMVCGVEILTVLCTGH